MSRGKGSEKQINYKIKKSLNFDGLIIEIVQKSQDVGNVWPTQSDDLETSSSKLDPRKRSIICSNCLQVVDFEYEQMEIAEPQDVFCSECYELKEAYNLVLNENDGEIFVYPSELAKYNEINFGDKNKSKIKRTR